MNTISGLDKRILILDGATGTLIQKYAPFESENNDMLNLTHPEIIERIHNEYIEAGADIIETNTFNCNRISQASHGTAGKAREMAYSGAVIARKAADTYNASHTDRTIYVAGSVGPTSKSLSLSPDVNDPSFRPYDFDAMAAAYEEQIGALIDGGADIILIETCFDALNVKAALYALTKLRPQKDFPVMISVSVADKSGRTLTGQTIEAFYASVSHYPLLSFGLNCSLGAAGLAPLVKEVAGFARCAVSCYPNAGLPNELGGYDETPEQMAADMATMASQGTINIAGGCCGTTPEHIRAIAQALKDKAPRKIPSSDNSCNRLPSVLTASGLETVRIESGKGLLTNIGERTNVAGSRKFARLIASGAYEEAMEVAASQIENGASVIDINMDDAMLDSSKEMTVFTRYISNDPNVSKAALMIDSSHWDTLLCGLKNAQGKSIVNSISLKEGETAFLDKALEINRLGGAMIVMAFDEKGQATDYERKTEICARAYRLLTEAGIPASDIIFDANVLSVATGIEEHSKYAADFIKAVKWIKENLEGALTSGGISNLSFAFRGNNRVREAMHSVFLYHARKAGLDMAIVNPGMLEIYDNIEPGLLKCIEDVIFDTDKDASSRLIAMAGEMLSSDKGDATVNTSETTPLTPEERLTECLVKGVSRNLAEDLMQVLKKEGSAVRVIEGVLMEAMEKVGKYFGDGKMFLPQVVKSAKIMKEAVSILQPYMDSEKNDGPAVKRPLIVIATVKGDVHDIGKNITSIVLNCNGFTIKDLGVMVDKEEILGTATREKADIIAVSGLITPSLFYMEEICREMAAAGMTTPLFVGGATTSALHTAVRLAPIYDFVFHGNDASATAVMAKRYMMDKEKFIREEHEKQENIRELYNKGKKTGTEENETYPEPDFPADTYLNTKNIHYQEYNSFSPRVSELMPLFDRKLFLGICGMKNAGEEESSRFMDEALTALKELSDDMRIKVSLRIMRAHSSDGCIVLENGVSLPMLRQESPANTGGIKARLSLCDFVPQKKLAMESLCGFFSISADLAAERDTSADLMTRALLDTLAEAASEWLDCFLREKAGTDGMKIIRPAIGYPCCPDHSLKREINGLLGGEPVTGIRLTESYNMIPDSSICGMVFFHKHACFPDIRRISTEQYGEYIKKRGLSRVEGEMLLGHLLRNK